MGCPPLRAGRQGVAVGARGRGFDRADIAWYRHGPEHMCPRRYQLQPASPPARALNYEGLLNDQQIAVVEAGPGPILVIAGAGSGKTRTLTWRVARLVADGAAPESILLLTFTNKAAREMLRRVEEVCRIDTRRITG